MRTELSRRVRAILAQPRLTVSDITLTLYEVADELERLDAGIRRILAEAVEMGTDRGNSAIERIARELIDQGT